MQANEAAYDLLQSSYDALSEQHAQTTQSLEMAQAEKADTQSEIQIMANGTAAMANQIRELQDLLSDTEGRLAESNEKRTRLQMDADGLNGANATFRRQANEMSLERDAVKGEVEEQRSLVSLRESEIKSLKEGQQDLVKKVVSLQRGMVEKEKTIEMCRDKMATKAFEADELRVKLQEMEAGVAEVQSGKQAEFDEAQLE